MVIRFHKEEFMNCQCLGRMDTIVRQLERILPSVPRPSPRERSVAPSSMVGTQGSQGSQAGDWAEETDGEEEEEFSKVQTQADS